MKVITRKTLIVETLYINHECKPLCNGIKNINDIVFKKSLHHHKNRIKNILAPEQIVGVPKDSPIDVRKYPTNIIKCSSIPEFTNKYIKKKKSKLSSSNTVVMNPYNSKFIVNALTEYQHPQYINSINNCFAQVKWRVYRCQISTKQEVCCCSCNSDAMFEVMKSLYDCYKKKDCDYCNCILCGHLPKEERKLGELRKSGTALPTVGTETKKGKAAVQKTQATMGVALEGAIPSGGFLISLEGKTPEQTETILKCIAAAGIPLPVGKTPSEKKLIDKVRKETGHPPVPKPSAEKKKSQKAIGIITPIQGKPKPEKEITEATAGAPVVKVSKQTLDKLRKAKAAGLLTPLAGKSTEEKEKILMGLAKHGLPMPEGKTTSEKVIIDKVRKDLGMPPHPKTPSMKVKYEKAQAQGLMTPLKDKSPSQKEKILKAQAAAGIPLPEAKTPSEKALIAKVTAATGAPAVGKIPSEKIRKAKAAGLLTPLAGKTTEQREQIVKGLAQQGMPLPEGKTASEKQIIEKVRKDLGMPPAKAAGVQTPLTGKSPEQKEKILKDLAKDGAPLPEGKTASEKKIIEKVRKDLGMPPGKAAGVQTPLTGKSPEQKEKILKELAKDGAPLPEGKTASEKKIIEKVRKDLGMPPGKAAGVQTPLKGKSAEQKEKILKDLAKGGAPLPEGKTASEKKIIEKVRKDMGMPPEPKTSSMRVKHAKAQAQGLMTPLEGKSPSRKEKILKAQAEAGLPLPEGRTPSEKALIAKVTAATGAPAVEKIPSEKLRKAKAAGLMTPLAGKTLEQREKIVKGLAQQGMPLPVGTTTSEKMIIEKVRKDLGMPPEPKTSSMRVKHAKAQAQGLMTPLEGKSPSRKEKILKAQAEAGLPLPEGRTPSEKALIAKVTAATGAPAVGKIPSEKLRKAKAAGLMTPLAGKTLEQREKIVKGLAQQGMALPVGKTTSEKMIIEKVRKDLGMPPEPKTSSMRVKHAKTQAQGLMTPLEGKSPSRKEKILKAQAEAGVPLPEGRTPSEKALIAKVTAATGAPAVGKIPSEKLRKAKAAGLMTPLAGKTAEQREKIVKGLAQQGMPLPVGKTTSEKKIIEKVRKDLGMPPEPKTSSMRVKHAKAQAQGLMTPLEGKSPSRKEKILKAQAEAGVPLPEGRTPSEKALIAKVTAATGAQAVGKIPSEKLRKAKAAGLMTPLAGKTAEQREKIVKGLAQQGMPLPVGKTTSEKKIIEKVRKDLGMPPEPKTSSMRIKHAKAQAQGLMTPLEGKSPSRKEKILKAQAEAGVPLPEGRTPSEKALIAKVTAATGTPTVGKVASEKLRKAKAAGLLTPLAGKTTEQREKILKGLAQHGIPLPVGKTPSEKKIIEKVKKDLKMPPEPRTPSMKEKRAPSEKGKKIDEKSIKEKSAPTEKTRKLDEKTAKVMKEGKGPSDECICGLLTPESEKAAFDKAMAQKRPSERLKAAKAAGVQSPLKGKSPEQREKILKDLAKGGAPLPEGKTASEKKIIEKVKKDLGMPTGKAAGVQTPLKGKSPEQKEKILKDLAKGGAPLPEGKTASEKKIIEKVRKDLGMPPEPKTSSMKVKHAKAQAQGLMTPLDGKSPSQKEKILKAQAEAGVPLPEGRTPSEKALIAKVTAATGAPAVGKIPSEKLRKAKAAGLMTPLAGKTAEQREKIVKGLAQQGMPLPVGKTTSEKKIIEKVRKDLGMPPEPKPSSMRAKEKPAGVMSPLAGKAIKTKSKTKTRKVGSGIAKAGIVEEFEDIHKTTTCDRGCGCDKKKIRFKHSYVKIRVTSPDISSLCPCPDECIPGVKGGVLVDSEGIKVTVGSAVGFPSFSTVNESKNSKNGKTSYNNEISKLTNSLEIKTTPLYETCPISDMIYGTDDFKIPSQILYINSNYSNGSLSTSGEPSFIYKENMQNSLANELEMKPDTSISTYLIACSESHSSSTSDFPIILQGAPCNMTSQSSSNSAIFKTEISLKFPIKSNASIGSLSIIPSHNSSTTSTSIHHLYDSLSSIHSEDTEYFTNVIDYCAVDSRSSENEEVIKYSSTIERVMYCVTKPSKRNRVETNNVYLTRTSQSYNAAKTTRKNREPYHNKHNSITVLSNLKNDRDDILKMVVDKILARYDIANSSSVYVIVADSDVNDTNLTDAASSTLSLRLPENFFDYSTESNNYQPLRKFFNKRSVAQGLKIETKRKKYYTKGTSMTFEDQKILDQHNDDEPTSFERQFRCFSMDTTEDKPCCCCCSQKEQDNTDYESKGTCMPNVFSELLTPMIVSQGFAQGLSPNAYHNVPRLNLTDHFSYLSQKQPTSIYYDVPSCVGGSGNCFKPPTHTMEAPMPQCAVGTQHPMDLDHFHNGLENIPPECNTPSIRILREMQRKQDEGSRNVTPCTHLLGEMQRNKGECSRNVTPCTHLPEEMQRKQTEFSRNVQFNGRGYVKCQATENNSTVPIRLGDNPCISSGQPTMKDKCINSYEKQKNVGLHDSRPCPGFKPTTVSAATEPICSPLISTGTCTCEAEISEGLNKKPCICKCKDSKTKKKKEKQNKIICECPVVIEKEVYIEPIIYNDEKEDMKMRSELTQTVSGFKFDFKKRLPLEEEISFEDALIFIEQNPCAFHGTNDCCTCDGKLQPQQQADCECNPAPNCECPNDPLLPQEMLVEEPLKGLKIHIGGKGSGSKGLAGICCFDMLQESNGILLLHD